MGSTVSLKTGAVDAVGGVASVHDGLGEGGFSPSDLSPLHWFDAGDATTITRSTTNVTGWEDKGSLGIDLSALGADDPQYTADDPSAGLGSILWDRTNDEALDTGSSQTGGNIALVEGTEAYMWFVFKLTGTSNSMFLWEIPTDKTTGTDTQVIFGYQTGSPGYIIFSNSAGGGFFNFKADWSGADTAIHICEIHYDGTASPSTSNVTIKIDDVALTTGTAAHGSFDNDIRVGGVTTVKTDAKIYEMVLANSTSASMYSYLADRWGVS